MMTFSFVR